MTGAIELTPRDLDEKLTTWRRDRVSTRSGQSLRYSWRGIDHNVFARVCVLPLDSLGAVASIVWDDRLHLATSMRSFRSEKVSAFVKAVLDCDVVSARPLLREVTRRYPIAVTRDLARAKTWIRSHARGSERYGLVASSQAQRLKPHAIDVRINVDPVQWFLNDRHDTRSSYYLEDAVRVPEILTPTFPEILAP